MAPGATGIIEAAGGKKVKLKEVCASTGLSRKTIRLYEEKGLLVPQMERRNGRDYREYTQEDVETLREIATLRRAWFTMDEIARMQQDPDTIAEIFPQYLQWLRAQKSQLQQLLDAAEQVNPSKVASVAQLSQAMETAAQMPLPQWDITPHFRYLDQLEEVRTMKEDTRDTQEIFDGRMSDTKAFRQVTLTMDQDTVNNQAITFGQMKELKTTPAGETGPVTGEVQDPKWIRVLSTVGGILLAGGFLLTAYTEVRDLYADYKGSVPLDVILGISALILGIVLTLSMRGLSAYRERRRWIAEMRRQDEEKRKKSSGT